MPQENGLLEMEGSVENIVYHNDSNQYTVLEVDCGGGDVPVCECGGAAAPVWHVDIARDVRAAVPRTGV